MEKRHPRILFRRRLKELREDVEQMGKKTMQAYRDSIKVLFNYDEEKVKGVIEAALKIDEMNYDLEHKTLSIIAAEQPVAGDLRFIEACIKIGSHLKRIGYLAGNITEVAKQIKDQDVPEKPMDDIVHMADIVENMVSKSLTTFLAQNMDTARELRRDDDKVDDLFDRAMNDVTKCMIDDPETIFYLVYLLFLARILERIADRAENIGDRTIFMITCKKP
jgi:phosphate transport system protein